MGAGLAVPANRPELEMGSSMALLCGALTARTSFQPVPSREGAM